VLRWSGSVRKGDDAVPGDDADTDRVTLQTSDLSLIMTNTCRNCLNTKQWCRGSPVRLPAYGDGCTVPELRPCGTAVGGHEPTTLEARFRWSY
jgi:hypothetical protein